MRKSVSGTEAVTLPSLLPDCFIPTVEPESGLRGALR